MLQRERGSPAKIRCAVGSLSRRTGRSDEGGFTVGLGWTFHSAGSFSLLDRNACLKRQGMMYAELAPRTLEFFNATNAKRN